MHEWQGNRPVSGAFYENGAQVIVRKEGASQGQPSGASQGQPSN